jgi:hypothetical protein
MTSEAAMGIASGGGRFAPYHRWDRNFFLVYVLLIWFGILNGFVPEIVSHLSKHQPFPLIVHVHAVAFMGWLVLLSVQVLFIRARRVDLHRRLGVAGAALAAAMIVLGPATALYMQRYHFGTPDSDPPFLAVQLSDIAAFAGLTIAAIALRKDSAAHKRLILLATLYISDAGFARFLGDGVHSLLGGGFLPFMAEAYLANDILVLGIGAYDLATRRRLHPAYVAGALWTLALQLTASWLYHAAFFKSVALGLIGH